MQILAYSQAAYWRRLLFWSVEMRKSYEEKGEKRVMAFYNADKIQWQRLIENPDLMNEVRKLQRSYGLPVSIRGINHPSAKEIIDWMGWYETVEINDKTGEWIFGVKGLRREKLRVEEKELAVHFEIPPKFFSSLHHLILTGSKNTDFLSGGFPTFNISKSENGEWVHQCIITPETDLSNPLVLNMIKHWQEVNGDKVPNPQPVRDNAKRLDWRPVWEWKKRHPDVSDKEIAKMLGKHRVTVSRALEIVDKENSLQK